MEFALLLFFYACGVSKLQCVQNDGWPNWTSFKASENKQSYEDRKELNKKIRKIERSVESLENEILQLESKISEIEEKLSSTDNYNVLLAEYESTKDSLKEKMALWEEQSEELETLKSEIASM